MNAPHSNTAEQGLLGAVFLNNEVLNDVIQLVSDADFYSYQHRLIFGSMKTLFNAGGAVEPLSIADILEANNQLDDAGGLGYVSGLLVNASSDKNAVRYAKTVRDKSMQRKMLKLTQELQDRITTGGDYHATMKELDALRDSQRAAGDSPYKLLSAESLLTVQPQPMLIKNILPAEGLASIYGPSGSGKSFLALDMFASLKKGGEWFGNRCKDASVLYVCLEGAGGLSQRLKAYRTKGSPENISFMIEPLDLTKDGDIEALIQTAKRAPVEYDVVVIDTLNRASPGADENSGKDMGQLLHNCERIRRELGGLLVLIHHTGKDVTKGLRGHSSLYAALDAAIEVKRSGDSRLWSTAKQKDGADGNDFHFKLGVVDVGHDEDGDKITSCVIRPTEAPADATRPRTPTAANQRIIFEALGKHIKTHGRDAGTPSPANKYAVKLEDAIEAIAGKLPCEPKRQKERARTAISGLTSKGFTECQEGWIWVI